MNVQSVFIHSPGDWTAGIHDFYSRIDNVPIDDDEHREEIRQGIADLYQDVIIGENVSVFFSDERGF